MRGIFRLLTGIVVALAVVWAGLWWYAQARLQAVLKVYAAEMTAPDGSTNMSYDGISGGGFPFAATATLDNPRLTLLLPGNDIPGPLVLGLSRVTLRIDVFNPLLLHIDMPDKITGHVPQGDGAVTFGSFNATAQLDPAALFNPNVFAVSAEDAAVTDINVLASSGSLQVLHIDSLRMHQTLNPSASAAQTGLALTEDVQGIALPAWLAQLLRVPFNGQMAHLGLNVALSGPVNWPALAQQMQTQPEGADKTKFLTDALHGWASQGGSGTASLSLTEGPTTLNANGTVKFDANAQPTGTADVTANHLDALTSRDHHRLSADAGRHQPSRGAAGAVSLRQQRWGAGTEHPRHLRQRRGDGEREEGRGYAAAGLEPSDQPAPGPGAGRWIGRCCRAVASYSEVMGPHQPGR